MPHPIASGMRSRHNGAMRIIAVQSLPGQPTAPKPYEFRIDDQAEPPIVHIPGDQRGPDLCIPDRPEQASWLDSHPDLVRPSWDCQWTCVDSSTLTALLRLLGPQL